MMVVPATIMFISPLPQHSPPPRYFFLFARNPLFPLVNNNTLYVGIEKNCYQYHAVVIFSLIIVGITIYFDYNQMSENEH